MSRFACNGDSTTSWPPTLTLPSLGGMKPVIMRMVVDLPAPLGPRKPSTSPRSTVNETPSTARLVPKDFTRLSILIIAARSGAEAEEFKGADYRAKRQPGRRARTQGPVFALDCALEFPRRFPIVPQSLTRPGEPNDR